VAIRVDSIRSPEAFVSEILSLRIFVTTLLFETFKSKDEWVLVLGHKISHLILSHSLANNGLGTSFRTLEIDIVIRSFKKVFFF